jgi:hypothetical protein
MAKEKKVAPKKRSGRKKQKGRGYLTISQIETALRATGGFVSYAAKKLNCTHQNVRKRIDASPYLQQVQDSIHEQYLDLTEHSLVKLIKEENLGAIIFYLKCQGKKRGYIEKPSDAEPPKEQAQPVKVVIEVKDGSKR